MSIYTKLKETIAIKGAAYLILIDPDKVNHDSFPNFISYCENSGVDGFLVGGSLLTNGSMSLTIQTIKDNCSLPAIIFPGSVSQVSENADAILYLSLISGRNPEYLIGSHVQSAPLIKKINLEAISTGYMIIQCGNITTAEYMSNTKPIPSDKPDIAAATALAGEYLGMKMIYLEGGSGASYSVPNNLIKAVRSQVNIPIIVGGGIRDVSIAAEKVKAGADIIITGNYFEDESNWEKIPQFAQAVHKNSSIEI